jgi:hypothetical protein
MSARLLELPVRAVLVSESQVSKLLEAVEKVKKEYEPKSGWLVGGKQKGDERDR